MMEAIAYITDKSGFQIAYSFTEPKLSIHWYLLPESLFSIYFFKALCKGYLWLWAKYWKWILVEKDKLAMQVGHLESYLVIQPY